MGKNGRKKQVTVAEMVLVAMLDPLYMILNPYKKS